MRTLEHIEHLRMADLERACYGANGDEHNGIYKVYVAGRSFRVVASNGGGWDHVSVSPCHAKRYPTWEEMCAIKDMFFGENERVVQYHPPKSEYVNAHPYCLHLWKWQGGDFPAPPAIFVGPKRRA